MRTAVLFIALLALASCGNEPRPAPVDAAITPDMSCFPACAGGTHCTPDGCVSGEVDMR